MLSSFLLSPLLSSVILFCIPEKAFFYKRLGLLFSIVIFSFSLLFFVFFDPSLCHFQYSFDISWSASNNFSFCFGIDGISLIFILLTSFLIPVCLLSAWDLPFETGFKSVKMFFVSFFLMEFFIFIVFCSLDLLIFYISFEVVLIPMFFVIGIWGSRERRIKASFYFFLYTLVGSLCILASMLIIYSELGSFNYYVLKEHSFEFHKEKLVWLSFFFAFCVKIPMLPFHVWLPEAHVEAPTAGSVLLAGILLKLGTFGIVRYLLGVFPLSSLFFKPLVYTLGIIAIVYSSFTAIRQSDMKRVIAYSSVAHMNLTVLGLFSFSITAFEGSLFQMISHGIVSGALFLCVGVLYDRHHSRLIKYYSGLTYTMPIFSFFFLLFTMGNIGLPGTSSFVGEFLILAGLFMVNPTVCFFAATSIVLGGAYSLWLFNRLAYGNFKLQYILKSRDLGKREFYLFAPLLSCILFLGFFPEVVLSCLHIASAYIFVF